jgi:hypothetical protein
VNRAITQAKLTFTAKQLSQINPAQPRSWYKTIKQVSGMQNKQNTISIPGHHQDSNSVLANAINEHFGDICSSLPALDTAELPAYLPAASPPPTVNRLQVWKELARIQTHKAPGPDRLPNRILK